MVNKRAGDWRMRPEPRAAPDQTANRVSEREIANLLIQLNSPPLKF